MKIEYSESEIIVKRVKKNPWPEPKLPAYPPQLYVDTEAQTEEELMQNYSLIKNKVRAVFPQLDISYEAIRTLERHGIVKQKQKIYFSKPTDTTWDELKKTIQGITHGYVKAAGFLKVLLVDDVHQSMNSEKEFVPIADHLFKAQMKFSDLTPRAGQVMCLSDISMVHFRYPGTWSNIKFYSNEKRSLLDVPVDHLEYLVLQSDYV